MNTRSALSIIIIAGIITSFSGCRSKKLQTEEEIEARTPVTIIPAIHKSISETLEFPAVSLFMRKNTIRTTTTGTIESISVTLGDYVKKGDPLFSLRTLEASIIQGSAHGDTSLIIKGIINVNSPEDGVLISISHQKGDFVQSGDELAVISDQSSLVFSLEVPFEYRIYFKEGSVCSLKLPDNTIIKGKITGRMPEMNVQAQTVSFFVLPVTHEKLPQNLMATALINKKTKENAQVLPRAALLGNETQTEFWIMKVVNDSTAIKIPVKKGIENYEEVEITDPQFSPTDKILSAGNYGLPDTASIVILQ